MIKKISFRFAVNTMLLLLSALLIYHLLIITQIIPYAATWGGRLKTDQEMYRFETISIVVNILIMLIIAIKGGHIKSIGPNKAINILLWIIVVLYALNTLGNIASVNQLEAIIFTPLTLMFTVLCARIAVE